MYSIPIPKVKIAGEKTNKLGMSLQDYQGAMSTLCGGCGHDSVTAAIVQAGFELSLAPHRVAKMSGIGCSSKTPAYFLKTAHGFNSVHGRMPAVTTGAYLAQRELFYLAVSGDGDTGSIGLGHFIHAIRRRLRMLYLIENNGVYGLTKGQFSATADLGHTNKKGEVNPFSGIDPLLLGIELGATFVARSFSGDKKQLVPLIKAGLSHEGFALIDVLSPCVSFNNHAGSSKSYAYIREHEEEALHIQDYVPERQEIVADYAEGSTLKLPLHDGTFLTLSKAAPSYDPEDKKKAMDFINSCRSRGEIATGLLYYQPTVKDFHQIYGTTKTPLRDIPFSHLCPGKDELAKINASFR